ncbi:MAG TPA: DNA primase, partial [Syntrophomonas sp.]|nr:DNA primase [Syntrophomonas sp.]
SRGIYKCFGCGKGGDAISFIMEHEHADFKEAVSIGARKLNLQFEWAEQKNFNEEDHKHKESLRIVCGKVAEYYRQNLLSDQVAKDYLSGRNFLIEDDDPFMIGYASPGNQLMKWAQDNALNHQLMIEAGILATNDKGENYDFFRERIMFPICDKTGKIIGFTGRTLSTKKETAKYLNSPDTEIYSKGKELFALNIARHAIKKENKVYLVEGNFDVKRMHSIGVLNTVAPCGTALTVEQVRMLKSYSKNVTLIYDGDEAGRKAIDRNGELLVKEQCNVMVLSLPDGQDPDSVFSDLETFEEYKDKAQQDYIIYKVEKGQKRCENPAYKSDFMREVAALITRYDDTSLHEVYIESLSQIIKPKKAWQDHVKMLVADKAPVEKKAYIPKTVSAEEFRERGFYSEENCYFFADSKGMPQKRSNFTLSPIFHIEGVINAKRLYEVKNSYNQVRVVEIPQRDMVSRTAFMVHIESLGNFWWNGSDSDLSRLKQWLYEKTESCKEIVQLGWQKEGFWAWGNGIFNEDFIPVDHFGIVKHGKKSFYIPAFSTIYDNEENLYISERKFIHMEGNITLREYSKKYISVFGDNAKIVLCFYFAALFRDIIARRFGIFPILNLFGPKGAGKTACGESIIQFFGILAKAPNINNTSKAALADHVAAACNAVCMIDEYRNDLEMEKREFMKGIWDGTGRTRMNMDKDKKKETTSVDQAVIMSGQQMATADIALFSRVIFLSFTKTEYSDEERLAFNQLKDIEKRGLTHITHQLLRLRQIFHDNFTQHIKKTGELMRKNMQGEVVEDRLFNNWLIPMSAYATLNEHLELPWDLHELIRLGTMLMIRQNKEMKKNDDLGNFWKVVQYLISSNQLFDGGDYKLEVTEKFIRRFYEHGEWKQQAYTYTEATQLLYLTTSRLFSLYKSQCLREGDKPLPDSTIEYYLRNSAAFVCETKKESFKKIDPRTGLQELDESGNKKRTSTTALVFEFSKLSLTVGSESDEEPAIIPDKADAIQNDLPFNEKTDDLPF